MGGALVPWQRGDDRLALWSDCLPPQSIPQRGRNPSTSCIRPYFAVILSKYQTNRLIPNCWQTDPGWQHVLDGKMDIFSLARDPISRTTDKIRPQQVNCFQYPYTAKRRRSDCRIVQAVWYDSPLSSFDHVVRFNFENCPRVLEVRLWRAAWSNSASIPLLEFEATILNFAFEVKEL